MKEEPKRIWLEALAPLVLLFLFGLAYNDLGELAGARGPDFANVIRTPLDARVPLVALFILPYASFWVLPGAILAYLYWRRGWAPAVYRRLFVALLVLCVGCSVLWLAFPVRVDLRAGGEVLATHGLLGELVRLSYAAATPWNACPSFHVAGSWFLLRTVQLLVDRNSCALAVLVGSVIVSTVLVRIHYLVDIAAGLLVSELVFRAVLVPLEARGSFVGTRPGRARALTAGVLVVVLAGYLLLLAR